MAIKSVTLQKLEEMEKKAAGLGRVDVDEAAIYSKVPKLGLSVRQMGSGHLEVALDDFPGECVGGECGHEGPRINVGAASLGER